MAPSSFSCLALALTCLPLISLIDMVTATKVVPLPFTRRPSPRWRQKRDIIPATLQNYLPQQEYFITVGVGTPPQQVELIVDTGSSDFWTFAPGACRSKPLQPCVGGDFDPSQSSTYSLVKSNIFNDTYGDGTSVSGNYIRDNVHIGGDIIKNLVMGSATHNVGNYVGLMGIGFDTNEAAYQLGIISKPYNNVPDCLVEQGLISVKAYSLYLDSLSSHTGVIIFGGYDERKFQGDLVILPMLSTEQPGFINEFAVPWTSMSVTDSNSKSYSIELDEYPLQVVLDSGSLLMSLPNNAVAVLLKHFNLQYDKTVGAILVPNCDLGKGTLNFGFGSAKGGVTIRVSYEELAIPFYSYTGELQTDGHGNALCRFGIMPAEENFVMGQTFLRSAYVLYDLDHKVIGLAPTVFDSNNTNYVEWNPTADRSRINIDSAAPQSASIRPYAGEAFDKGVSVVPTVISTPAYPSPMDNTHFISQYPKLKASGSSGNNAGHRTHSASPTATLLVLGTLIVACIGGLALL